MADIRSIVVNEQEDPYYLEMVKAAKISGGWPAVWLRLKEIETAAKVLNSQFYNLQYSAGLRLLTCAQLRQRFTSLTPEEQQRVKQKAHELKSANESYRDEMECIRNKWHICTEADKYIADTGRGLEIFLDCINDEKLDLPIDRLDPY